MQKFNVIQQLVENLANEQRLEFVLHDDSPLPSIPEQLKRFANASIIIGPHGAGMVSISLFFLLTTVLSVLRNKDSDYPFGIFKLLIYYI
jgi:capsular polysaccharide biosynthesis protein